MALTLSGAVTGAAQTGFTSPTYTVAVDTAPAATAKQWLVASTGGTQSGVIAHSIANPFTWTMFRPAVLKTLGGANPVTGVIDTRARNVWRIVARKGVLPYTNGPTLPAVVRMEIDLPAGADFTDPANVRALMSFVIGVLSNQSAGIGDSIILGNI